MKNRVLYLSKLIQFKDKPLIKVITGIRRCGKSTLLSLFEKHLIADGTAKAHVIRINLESFEFDEITTYKALHAYIKERMHDNTPRYYILLDEVQLIQGWEKAVNALLVDANVDVYITGSNAHLLSSELSTLLSGRYVEIKMQPLSFKEYLDFTETVRADQYQTMFDQYLKFGGLPTVVELLDHIETIDPFLEGVYNTVLMKDVVERNSVRDPALLESILKFLAANVGSIVSTKKISDYLSSSGRKTTSDTIDNYLKMLESAFIIYKANRYDLKGKMFLKTLEKYYMVDMGIRNRLAGLRNTDYGHVLENVVYLELIRRGYEVSIGKIGTLEVDFIAEKTNERIYYQVSATVLDETSKVRELRPLQAIADNYPKYMLTMDQTIFNDYAGIKVQNIIDFLLE
ncbi:MAG: AAA family ATPase [Acidaminobacter sp.]|uniref:ATP-binding protein n=1 Tax=Acidaminobacter sp. TaxID=1872102 RepID=UPI0013811CDF|nr:ATP-binding protein [Acidaminobacter sp.]MZQ99266.1 AAA family ATPase [Acidaminobacter sp.]